MEVAILLDRIANQPTMKESTLDGRGIQKVLEDAFVKITAKVQKYVDKSIELKTVYKDKFGGFPPTELDASLQPNTSRTAAIDQQRQLYAGARVALVNPKYGDNIIDELVDWHDASSSDHNG